VVTLRVLITVFLLLTLLQPVLAGMFVTGDADLLTWHELNAHAINATSWFLVLDTVLLWRPGRGPAWPMAVAVPLSASVTVQGELGYARELAVHIPLGVLLVACATALTYWSYSFRPHRGTGR
jgi:hypothetical protein